MPMLRELVVGAQLLGDFPAVLAGHHHVEQHEVGMVLAREVERLQCRRPPRAPGSPSCSSGCPSIVRISGSSSAIRITGFLSTFQRRYPATCSPSRHGCQSRGEPLHGIPATWRSAPRLLCLNARTFGLEATVLRIIRIALLALVPMLAIGTLAVGLRRRHDHPVGADMCASCTTSRTPVVHDMAQPHVD